MHSHTYRVNLQHMYIILLKHISRIMVSWWLNKMFKMSTYDFHAGITGDRLLGLLLSCSMSDWGSLPWIPTNVLAEILQDVDLQTMSRAWLWFTTFSSCNSDDRQHGLLIPLHFYPWRQPKFTVCSTDASDVCNFEQCSRMDFRWCAQNWKCLSGNHCTDVQHPALKLRMETELSFFRRPMFVNHFSCIVGYIQLL